MKRFFALLLVALLTFCITAVPANAASYATGSYTVTSNAGVNVRSGAGAGYSRVGVAKYGTVFSVTKTNGDWGYAPSIACSSGTKSGWVCLSYCRYNGSSSRSSYNDVFTSLKGSGYSVSQALSFQATTFQKDTFVYVWAYVHDANDNLYKSYGTGTCNMSLSLYRPDGSCAHSYTYNNSDNNWIGFKLDQVGTWKIQSKITGSLSGTNTRTITVTEANPSVLKCSELKDGTFVRIRYAANGKYLDVPAESATKNGAQLQIWDSAPSNTNQYFWLKNTGKGWQIVSLHSGKVIEVRDSSHNDCAQVAQWDMHTLACARWSIIDNSDGTVSFKNKESGLYLNVCGGGNAPNGTKMIQYHDDGTEAMKFFIEAISLGEYTTSTEKVSSRKDKDLSVASWHPLNGLTQTMLQQDDDLEALVDDIPGPLNVASFAISWISNSKEITRIHVAQGSNNKMNIQYDDSIEANLSGKKISLDTLLVQRYYGFSPTIIFTSGTKADECIRNWFGVSGSGKYSMEFKFGKVKTGEYGYYLLLEHGVVYQVPIIHSESTYNVYYTENGKTSYLFDAAQILRNTKLQLKPEEATVVVAELIKNGYIK